MAPRGLDLTPSGRWGIEGFPECLSLQSTKCDSNDNAVRRRTLSEIEIEIEIAVVLGRFRKFAKSGY